MAPLDDCYGEIPLHVLSGHGHVVVYDNNGAEVVPFTAQDWKDEPLLNVPGMASCLKRAYENPTEMVRDNQGWMKGQYEDDSARWADGEDGPDWFDPEPLPSSPEDFSEKDYGASLPLEVIVEDDDVHNDPNEIPDHRILIEDANEDCIYSMHAEEYRQGVEPVSGLIESIRLAYEDPLLLLHRQS